MINLENNDKYYDPEVLEIILESIFLKSLNEIKESVQNEKIYISEKEIKEFLNKEFIANDLEMKKRLKQPDNNRNINEWTDDDIKFKAERFSDEISSSKYFYEPYTLKYFQTYTNILKEKINSLLYIIENLVNKEIDLINETLFDLDIILDQNNNILKANDFKTYLEFKLSLDSVYSDGFTEAEIYPSKEIQIKDLFHNHTPGNIDLTKNQEAIIEKENDKFYEKVLSMIN